MVGVPLSVRYEDLSTHAPALPPDSHLGDEFLIRDPDPAHQPQLRGGRSARSRTSSATSCSACTAAAGYLFDQEPSTSSRGRSSTAWSSRAPGRPGRRAGGRSPPSTSSTTRRTTGALDVSVRAGIEIDGVLLTRKLQFLLEYFNGHSPNGQFYKDRVAVLRHRHALPLLTPRIEGHGARTSGDFIDAYARAYPGEVIRVSEPVSIEYGCDGARARVRAPPPVPDPAPRDGARLRTSRSCATSWRAGARWRSRSA